MPPITAPIPPRPHVRVLRGYDAILNATAMLERLAVRSGQTGAMQDIVYYLSKPGVFKRVPQLPVFFSQQTATKAIHGDKEPIGALLLFEYYLLGSSLKLFTTNDRSGRNTLVSSPRLRSELVRHGVDFLLEQGAHTILISYRRGLANSSSLTPEVIPSSRYGARSASREQDVPDYLPLAATYEATLSTIGQRTRSNMRYNRRRAEVKLGCKFHPSVAISREEFLAFNRETMYKVAESVAMWRYEVHQQLAEPLLMGLRDQDGRWLALVGGRRFACGSEILWQMNRDGLPLYSLSLVARSYFIEHEIAHGSKALYVEGGTAHPIHFSFARVRLTQLAVLRRSARANLTRKFARKVINEENELARMLFDPKIVWHSSPHE